MSTEAQASTLPAAIARKLVSGARQSDRAMVVGNRAGVVEWANAAWTRVTGYALDESIGKPVQSFLEHVDVDPGVVDFVARCFGEGKACEVEFPLSPPGRETLWIQLRVEPLFDSDRAASDFIAIATDVTEQKRTELGAGVVELDLSELALQAARDQRHQLGAMIEFDFELPANLPLVLADERAVLRIASLAIARAVEDIRDGWGTVTLITGTLGAGTAPMFRGHFDPPLPDGHWAFLEIHDTGCFPSGAAYRATTEPLLSTRFPADALRMEAAQDLVRAQNGELRVESSPVTGTSVILLFPFADDGGFTPIA